MEKRGPQTKEHPHFGITSSYPPPECQIFKINKIGQVLPLGSSTGLLLPTHAPQRTILYSLPLTGRVPTSCCYREHTPDSSHTEVSIPGPGCPG